MAKQLLDKGARVLVCARNQQTLEMAKVENPDIHTFPCDVTQLDQVKILLEECCEVLGGVDVLINNAAIYRRFNFLDDYPIEKQIEGVDINLIGLIHVTNVFLKELLKSDGPVLVNLTSPAAIVPLTTAPAYSAVKAAVSSYTTSLRFQLRDTKAKVVLLCPPAVDTRMNEDNPGVEAQRLMSKKKFVSIAIKELSKDKEEILVSPINMFKQIHRFAPGVAFRMLNKK